jgi:hypothetical protein
MGIKNKMEPVDWMNLAQDRDRCWAHVNTAINLQVPYNVGNYTTRQGTSSILDSVLWSSIVHEHGTVLH